MTLRLVSAKKLLSNLQSLSSVLCVVVRENGELGTAISDQYLESASPWLNTTSYQDIEDWIQERNVGGIVFALPQLVDQEQSPSLLEQKRKALLKHSWQSVSLACTMDDQLSPEDARAAAEEEIEKDEEIDLKAPSASTCAAIALNHFLSTAQLSR